MQLTAQPILPSAPTANEALETLISQLMSLRMGTLPETAVVYGRAVLLDALGMMIGARRQLIAGRLATYLEICSSPGPCTSFCGGGPVDAESAAFVNATISHDLSMDDMHQKAEVHGGAVLVPTALAVAEEVGATADDLLLALVRGYDVACRISNMLDHGRLARAGFHPTSVAGAMGAAAVAASLLGFAERQFLQAVQLAASLCSGIMACKTEPDHYTKSLHCGIAARHGIAAARAVRNEVIGDGAARATFLSAVDVYAAGAPLITALTDGLGTPFEITRTTFKFYPCCTHIIPLLDALDQIRKRSPLRSEDVQHMDLFLYSRGFDSVNDNSLRTHNARYVMALALEYGTIERRFFSEAFAIDPLRPLMDRITLHRESELDRFRPAMSPGIVTIRTKDGAALSQRVDCCKGTPENPPGWAEVQDKFRSNVAPIIGEDRAQVLADGVLAGGRRVAALTCLSWGGGRG